MGRIRRFADNRYVGVRDEMVVYDCDDPVEFAALEARVTDDDVVARSLISTFGPDTLAEARNRGYRQRSA